MSKIFNLSLLLIFSVLLLAACSSPPSINLMHIHGLGYSSDGKQVMLAGHDGLTFYENESWKQGVGEQRDYMGFNAVDNGFYSSGHPAENSNEKDPLGIVKSADYGKTIQLLDLYGIEDFHDMAVGYKTHAIYVYNLHPNPKMPSSGLYASTDDAKTWVGSEMKGFPGEPFAIAAHPTDPKVLALITKEGLWVSKDRGNHFESRPVPFFVTGIAYGINGGLMLGGQESIVLNQDKGTIVKLPALDQNDAVQYLAQNPTKQDEIVFATYKRQVYISSDYGKSWKQIAKEGKSTSN